MQVQKAVNKVLEQHQQTNLPQPPPSTTSSTSSSSTTTLHIQKLESLNMELQELLNTTAAALVDTARKHEVARAEIDSLHAERSALHAEVNAERNALRAEVDAELRSREREAEGLRWQLAAIQKRADESFAVQEKMRYITNPKYRINQ